MTIKEIEDILGIPKASIRFYEKEGLLIPQRDENGYRNYSNKDVDTLREIIIFRKLGFSIEKIDDLLNNEVSLQTAIDENIADLETRIKKLNGAIFICKELKSKHIEMDTFDNETWWNRINTEEKRGSRFMDIASDIMTFYGKEIEIEMGLRKEEDDEKPINWKSIIIVSVIAVVVWCILSVLIFKETLKESLEFCIELEVVSAILALPKYFIGKKSKSAAKKYDNIIGVIGVIVLLTLIAFGIVSWLS